MMQFELPKERPSIIKVIGVGGGGSNAVNYMYRLGIKGVDFLVCNTDHQALDISPVPVKIQLGPSLTEGRGAGSIPEVGKNAAIENIDELKNILRDNTRMVFITAGMGGGTGTGAAPIIAGVAREMGILTVAIVTVPFGFEGKKRKAQADAGLEELKRNVDTLLVICNDKLREIHGDLKLSDAFGHADNILAIAAKSIAEIITTTLHINVDFADIQTVMKDSGVAIMGSAYADGENRAIEAVKNALDSPLLNDNEIEGARYILLNITSGDLEVTMDEMGEITDFIQEQAGMTAEVIMGVGKDDSLGNKIGVTIIATGFKTKDQLGNSVISRQEEKVVYNISGEVMKKADPIANVAAPQAPKVEAAPAIVQVAAPIKQTTVTVEPETQHQPLRENERVVYNLNEDAPAVLNIIKPEAEKITNAPSPAIAKVAEEEKTFIFNLGEQQKEATPVVAPPVIHQLEPVAAVTPKTEVKKEIEESSSEDDPFQRAKERIYKLREMSMKMNTPTGLTDLEKEPAYKRKNVNLNAVPSSNDSQVSRFTLTNDQDNKPEIKSNNTFLHDRVD
jgi:cell division protein FtsZ